jgi:hypothetical protein|tara:strand:- start:143 stop:331 length:189 start_codon:yes stop_codon:yes gene_type:complete
MKDYLAKSKPVSPFTDAKLDAYLSAGNTVQSCAHGESGGLPLMYKEMVKKQVEQSKKKRKAA